MAQKETWEREYSDRKLVSLTNEPHADIVRLVRTLKKEFSFTLFEKAVLDVGCGTGRNAYYFAQLGAQVTGIDISHKAIQIAISNTEKTDIHINYIVGDISTDIPNQSFDFIIDILASNSLHESERASYLRHIHTSLAPGGFFFVRTLAKEGDKNAQRLLKDHPGKETDTYIMPGFGLVERVFSKNDFLALYGEGLELISLLKKAHYPTFDGRTFKRNYYYALFRKPL